MSKPTLGLKAILRVLGAIAYVGFIAVLVLIIIALSQEIFRAANAPPAKYTDCPKCTGTGRIIAEEVSND